MIRADANEQIGAGHVMRCLSIADAFRDIGEEALFVTADHKADQMIHGKGFESVCLDSDWKLIGRENLKDQLDKYHPDVLIVDSYYVTESCFDGIPDQIHTVYIDDLNEKVFKVDFLINYNIFSSEMDYSLYAQHGTKLLLGSGYAPLRKEFRGAGSYRIRKDVRDVFVSAGGSDPLGITERLIAGICPVWPDIRFHFVIGELNPRMDEIRRLAGNNIVLYVNEQNMAGLMKQCDIAISAAGSTLYELCAVGVPTITYTLADNQRPAAEQFQKQGIMVYAGDCRKNKAFDDKVCLCLADLLQYQRRRQEMSVRMQKLIDGQGAARIARRIGKNRGDF